MPFFHTGQCLLHACNTINLFIQSIIFAKKIPLQYCTDNCLLDTLKFVWQYYCYLHVTITTVALLGLSVIWTLEDMYGLVTENILCVIVYQVYNIMRWLSPPYLDTLISAHYIFQVSMLPVPSSLTFSSPVGVFEFEKFATATKAVMDAVVIAT